MYIIHQQNRGRVENVKQKTNVDKQAHFILDYMIVECGRCGFISEKKYDAKREKEKKSCAWHLQEYIS